MEFKDRKGRFLNRKKLKVISQTPTEIIVDVERYDEPTEEGTKIDASVFNDFQNQINQANSTASLASSIAVSAKEVSNNTNAKSDDAVVKSTQAVSDSSQAVATANESNVKSSNAVETSNLALQNSENAMQSAITAVQTSNDANTSANNALSISQSAYTTATEAKEKSELANTTANSADAKSTTALTNSEKAIEDSTFAKEKSIKVEKALADRGATVLFGQEPQSTISFDSNPQTQINSKLNKAFSSYPIKNTLANNDTFVIQDAQTAENKNVQIATITSAIVNATYPLGAIYLSVNSVNPGEIFGGTWERIMGKFLLGADDNYMAGTSGGEANHVLTNDEIPSHNHSYSKSNSATEGTTLNTSQMPAHSHDVWSTDTWSTNAVGLKHGSKAYGVAGVDQAGGTEQWASIEGGDSHQIIRATGGGQAHNHSITLSTSNTENTGSSQAHNNMPPYLAVYMWKRIG